MSGDSRAYGHLFELHRQRFFRMAFSIIHDRGEAEDAVQDTFVRGLDRLSTYRGEAPPGAWFSSIALNVCRHRLRDAKREAVHAAEERLERGRTLHAAAITKAIQRECAVLIAAALGQLTEAQREVFVLHYDQGLDYGEIGRLVGIRPGAARALAHRARAALRRRLAPAV